MTSPQSDTTAPNTRFVAGTIWMVAMRWAMRFVGFFSSIILARLLAPEDFGLVAMAMMVVALIDTLSSTGVDLALIRERDTERKLYNAAWTIQVIQGAIVAVVMLCAMPFIADYFGESKLYTILTILAGAYFFQGFKNIGIVAFRKELDFAREFRFSLYVKLLSFVVTVAGALLLRDYRAIVLGMVFKSIFELILSYTMHPFRPKFSTDGMKQIWGFSQWLLVSSVGGVINGKASQFIVGGSLGTTSLGYYYLAAEVGTMFVQEIVMPIRRALFPNLSLLQDDSQRFAESGIKILGVVTLLCLPVGVGLSIVAGDIVRVLFGQNWLNTVPILQWTALIGAVAGISMSLSLVLMVRNRVNLTAIKILAETAVLIPVLVWVGKSMDPVDVARAKLLVSVAFLPVMYWLVAYTLECSTARLFSTLWRPLLAAAGMYYLDMLLLTDLQINVFLSLFLHAAAGVFSYVASLYLLWLFSGRPDSSEQIIFSIAAKLVKG
ncbi:MAG: lipopolysaccharide biosynthesis protein [Pseudomonadales bacterium]|nr:lipopolysaccharide biosynthesis protein [Pseudomonadales bacterium]MCP5172667.1 lipopolysaccharide biosynthesis protein [Pseudomonadales bacterium]MCP5302141.1 lipopolysaccharide biosynthesis protein [Pseudomonadales bacterium]